MFDGAPGTGRLRSSLFPGIGDAHNLAQVIHAIGSSRIPAQCPQVCDARRPRDPDVSACDAGLRERSALRPGDTWRLAPSGAAQVEGAVDVDLHIDHIYD